MTTRRRTVGGVAAALVALAAATVSSQRTSWNFDDVAPGRTVPGFVFTDGQPGLSAAWQVVRDGPASVLAHTSQSRSGIDLAVASGTSFGTLSLSARLRFPEAAHAAGIAWRYRDPDNYYSLALDLRAQSLRIYRVVSGNRTRLEDEDDLELDATAWHTLKVEDSGSRMRVWLNGVPVADTRDRSLREPGAVGFWTSGDAAVWFDDLQAEPLAASPRGGNRRD